MSAEICPRCLKLRPNVGPCSGEGDGGNRRLCGGCKFEITMADPDRRKRLEQDIRVISMRRRMSREMALAPFVARGLRKHGRRA